MKRNIEVDVKPTPSELAIEFCEMSGHGQAEFFNMIMQLSRAWDRPLCFQLQSIVDSNKLNSDGLAVMREIGEYSGAN